MSFYTLKFTDPLKPTFPVTDNTVNGPTTPLDPTPIDTGGGVVRTTLRIVGRSSVDYGEPIQQNLVYMLENFSSVDSPVVPIQGQLWYKNDNGPDATDPLGPTTRGLYLYDGGAWVNIPLSGSITSDIDMNGFNIVNLGNAVNPGDAVSLGFGDARYVNVSGDTMTGSLVLTGGSSQISLPNAPTLGVHATNKTYVDVTVTSEVASQIAAAIAPLDALYVNAAGDTMTGTLVIQTGNLNIQQGNITLDLGSLNVPVGDITMTAGDLTVATGNIVMSSGDILNTSGDIVLSTGGIDAGGPSSFSGTLLVGGTTTHDGVVFMNGVPIVMVGGGAGIDMGANRISNMGDPILSQDAATKAYVDLSIGTSGADGVTYAGSIDGVTGEIRLLRTLGLPDVVLSGAAAPFSHTHTSLEVNHNADPAFPVSFIRPALIDEIIFPNDVTLGTVLDLFDTALSEINRQWARQIIISDGVTATYSLPREVRVTFNQLQVFVDGVKYIASEFAEGLIEFSPRVVETTDTGLATSTAYAINLTVNGTPYVNFTITTGATGPVTFWDLVGLIDDRLATLSIPAVCVFDAGLIKIISTVAGAGSSVLIDPPSAGTNLLTSFVGTTATAIDATIATTYAYEEDGLPYQTAGTFTFTSIPPAGTTIELLLLIK